MFAQFTFFAYLRFFASPFFDAFILYAYCMDANAFFRQIIRC